MKRDELTMMLMKMYGSSCGLGRDNERDLSFCDIQVMMLGVGCLAPRDVSSNFKERQSTTNSSIKRK